MNCLFYTAFPSYPASSDIVALAVGFLGSKGTLCTHFWYGILGIYFYCSHGCYSITVPPTQLGIVTIETCYHANKLWPSQGQLPRPHSLLNTPSWRKIWSVFLPSCHIKTQSFILFLDAFWM